jgi:hypothetical protein
MRVGVFAYSLVEDELKIKILLCRKWYINGEEFSLFILRKTAKELEEEAGQNAMDKGQDIQGGGGPAHIENGRGNTSTEFQTARAKATPHSKIPKALRGERGHWMDGWMAFLFGRKREREGIPKN